MHFLAFILVTLFATGALAQTDPFDSERGEVRLDRADFGVGFESVEPDDVTLLRYDTGRRPSNDDAELLETEAAMEGDSVLVIGGDVQRAVITLNDDIVDQFRLRRVEFRVWYRPLGTKIDAKMIWISGDPDGQLIRAEPTFFIHTMGGISFQPTGRITDDGWQELSSGPVDFLAGSTIAPGWFSFEDVNAAQDGIAGIVGRDPDARVWVDAFTVTDLGPALVPDAACTATTAESACGDHGVCFLGKCTDAATYLGASPQDADVRANHLARRIFEVETFNGVRVATGPNISTYSDFMAAADSPNAKLFWGQQVLAYNALVDGHGRPPTARVASGIAGGACAYVSETDLSPTQTTGLMVWETHDEVPFAAQMQPGDVITAIDGLPPFEFAELAYLEESYGGDPNARDTINAIELLRWAVQYGASWEIERCGQATPCAANEIQTITVDPSADIAPIWDGLPPSFRFVVPQCDFRIDRLNGAPDERAYGFAGATVIGNVDVVLFNGFPRANTMGGQSGWFVTLNALLSTSPQLLLMDQRWGTGGYPDALQGLHDLLLASTDPPMFGETFPAGPQPTGEQRASLQNFCTTRYCGMYAPFNRTPAVDGPGANTQIAVLNGYDVSANDLFSRRMSARPGRTRMFGHGPTFGGFGFACKLPPHLPGEANPAYQCTDSTFSSSLANPDGVFESGTGVSPDELVLQRQSDMLLGIDTMRQRALEWLETGQ